MALALVWGAGEALPATYLERAVGSYRDSPSARRRAQLIRYASIHRKDQNGGLANLALGLVAYQQKDYPAAIKYLKSAQTRLPQLTDYVAYYLAAAETQANDLESVAGEFSKVRKAPVLSPLLSKATLVAAQALVAGNKPAEAARLLTMYYPDLAQPAGDLALAAAYEAANDAARAAGYYQRVYYRYPSSDEATQAGAALQRLRTSMGDSYPPPMPQEMLARANKFLASGDYSRAQKEFQSLIPELGGAARDEARVGVGVAEYMDGRTVEAHRYLNSLQVSESESDAQRLYYLVQCARRMDDDPAMMSALEHLDKFHPKSQWRLKALVSAGNRFLLTNQPDRYVPLYRAAYRSFSSDPLAAYCHWKVTWNSYLRRKPDAGELLREHLKMFPDDTSGGAALYFLGRLEETRRDYAGARAYYRKAVDLYPNFYYGILARERLADRKLTEAAASENIRTFLRTVSFTDDKPPLSDAPTPETRLRIERSRLLRSGGFSDWADAELRFGAKHDGQPALLAVEMARHADSPAKAMRVIKSVAPDYLTLSLEDAPAHFWNYLFPMPYRNYLMSNARLRNLDPYMLAGLIRQESEFDPRAVSRSKAYGLTQVKPSTGRLVARRAGVRRFRNYMLLQPATNLRVGTYYLRLLLNEWDGKWAEALASYNAGKSRVENWAQWASYREQAEFVETIPFTETREYVQAVLRNADLYRRLYSRDTAANARVEKRKTAARKAKRRSRRKTTHAGSAR